MKRRRIDPDTKLAAVLEGLKGESSITDICRKYQISESLYYRWRYNFLEAGSRVLASSNGATPRGVREDQDFKAGAEFGDLCPPR